MCGSRWNLPLLDNMRDISGPLGAVVLKKCMAMPKVTKEFVINCNPLQDRVNWSSYQKGGTRLALSLYPEAKGLVNAYIKRFC